MSTAKILIAMAIDTEFNGNVSCLNGHVNLGEQAAI